MHRIPAFRRGLSTARRLHHDAYAATLPNLKINENTRVIFQGFTGKQATTTAAAALRYGTRVVGGVTPGRTGEHLGLPVLPNMAEAARILKPDATAVFVAARHAAKAIEDAIAAEIPLVVAVAEHVPVHDMLRIHDILRTQRKTRLVGANSPGIINPRAHCLVGFLPHPTFLPGCIGIVAKSGTLSYEAVAATTRAGLGQSLVLGAGGDWLAGTTLAEGVQVLLDDDATEGVIVIGEIGGDAEMQVAQLLRTWRGRRKPVMALVAGITEAPGAPMGHAGAVRMFGDVDAPTKINALRSAGVEVVRHPAQFGPGMLKLLGRAPPATPVRGMGPDGPRRGFHTQRRELHIRAAAAASFLRTHAPALPLTPAPAPAVFSLALTIDRAARQPTVLISTDRDRSYVSHPFRYSTGPPSALADSLAATLGVRAEALRTLLADAWRVFTAQQLYALHLRDITGALRVPEGGCAVVLDDAATAPPLDAAGKLGISFRVLPGAGTVGTLVNGAGLAMNTVDALGALGVAAANFLDTGGRATSETVMESLRLVLADRRVRVVFVNICGGLTDCAMVARGIVLAFERLRVRVPVLVRLRGTNEEAGERVIRESGLGGVEVVGGVEEAARRVQELTG